jgi:acetoin utilization deacetylase AcuC-like enzyme
MRFATYLHPETLSTSRHVSDVDFVGKSYPHYSFIARALARELSDLPSLPLRMAGLEEFQRVHLQEYIEALTLMEAGKPCVRPKLSIECSALEYCLPGYSYGLGGFYEAIDHMKRGSLDRAFLFSLPGHHGFRDWGHGYCLLNPMAVAVRYAQQAGFGRALIIDWDIHHGDGTQQIFANDPGVHQISIHSGIDIYMMKASRIEAGTVASGRSTGHCNIPVINTIFDDVFAHQSGFVSGFYRGNDCLQGFDEALARLPFDPQIIFIFAGCDAHIEDCGRNVTNWTTDTFATLTRMVVETSRRSNCPILSVQGGGYNQRTAIEASCMHVRTLLRE